MRNPVPRQPALPVLTLGDATPAPGTGRGGTRRGGFRRRDARHDARRGAATRRPARGTAPALALSLLLLTGLPAGRVEARTAGGDPHGRAGGGWPIGTWTFRGGGWGHGVGMSQYGALGMASRGRSAAQIIRFYYGGARVAAAKVPATIRVGLLQGRTGGIVLRAGRVPGTPPGAPVRVTAIHSVSGKPVTRSFPQGVDLEVVRGASGLELRSAGKRVLGPGKAGTAMIFDYSRPGQDPVLLTLPQAGRTLRWGRVEVAATGGGESARLRAVAIMGWTSYLRGLAEVPRSWPLEVQRAQAIAARSYALAIVRTAGQHRGKGSAGGCDCAVYADVRDQHYAGWAQERGAGAERWVEAVSSTRGTAVVWKGETLVKAFYSSSNGGHTAGDDVWGGPGRPYYPVKRDPDDDAGGRNPFHTWTEHRTKAAVSKALGDLGVGDVTEVRAVTKDASGRVRTALVTGTRDSALISGQALQRRLKLRSTRLTSATPPPPPPPSDRRRERPPERPPATTAPKPPRGPGDGPGRPAEPGTTLRPPREPDDDPEPTPGPLAALLPPWLRPDPGRQGGRDTGARGAGPGAG